MMATFALWLMMTLDVDRNTPVLLTRSDAVTLIVMLETRDADGKAWADAMLKSFEDCWGTLEDEYQEWTLESYLRICQYLDVLPAALARSRE